MRAFDTKARRATSGMDVRDEGQCQSPLVVNSMRVNASQGDLGRQIHDMYVSIKILRPRPH
jgi:hypothetical protein